MSPDFVSLDLHQSTNTVALADLQRLLDLLEHAFADPDDESAKLALRARISAYRRALQGGAGSTLVECGHALLEACNAAIDGHNKLRAARRAEVAELVSLIRDATVSLMGDGAGMAAEMTASAARFAALGNISDIRLLKDRLSKEVTRLKGQADERERKLQATVGAFKAKIDSLEHQLIASQQEAALDPLTGIANRRLFDTTLAQKLKESSRAFSLVLIDVDAFKQINDTLGHGGGDRALQAIAHAFATQIRSMDMIARLGGDEFAVILEDVTLTQAAKRVTGITSTLGDSMGADLAQPLSVSCGVAECSAGDTPQSLMKRADDALYDAKRQGPGRVVQKAAALIRDMRSTAR